LDVWDSAGIEPNTTNNLGDPDDDIQPMVHFFGDGFDFQAL